MWTTFIILLYYLSGSTLARCGGWLVCAGCWWPASTAPTSRSTSTAAAGLHSSAGIPNSCGRSCSCCSIESMESDWQWQWTVMIRVNKLIGLPSDPPATHRQTYEQCLTMFWMKNIVFRESCYSWQWAKFLCPSLIELSKTPWTIWILYSSF